MQSGARPFLLLVATSILAACGSGSSDSTPTTSKTLTDRSPAELKKQYGGYVESRYEGSNALANLDADPETIQLYAAMLFGPADIYFPFPPQGFYNRVLYGSDRMPATYLCSDGGTFTMDGSLNSDGVGNVRLEYENCVENYDIVLNGSSMVSLLNSEGSSYTVYYDNLELTLPGYPPELLSGFVSYAMGDNAENFDVDVRLLSTNTETGFQRIDSVSRSAIGDNWEFEGTFVASGAGTVSISTQTPITNYSDPQAGTVKIGGALNQSAYVDIVDPTFTRVLFDGDGNNQPELGYYFTSLDNFLYSYLGGIELVAIENAGFPPEVAAPILKTPTPDTTTDIVVEAGSYSDRDTDISELSISYRWMVNGTPVTGIDSATLPSSYTQKDDEIVVFAVVSDGQFAQASNNLAILIGDAPATLNVSGIPDTIEAGQLLSVTATFSDPDEPGPASPATLLYGPSGMEIDSDGTLQWHVEELLFDASTITFGLGIGDSTDEAVDYSIDVINPGTSLPIARSGITVPGQNHAMFIGDFLGDSGNEILTMDNQRVFALSAANGGYEESWAYPYAMPTDGSLTALTTGNLDTDPQLELVVATEHGISVIGGDTDTARPIYETSRFVDAIAMADVNDDSIMELAILTSESEFSSATQSLTVLALDGSATQLFETALNGSSREMVIGNVDADAQLEIVLSSGLVYDGTTWANEWYLGTGFSDGTLAAGDLDADGIDEILAADAWGAIKVFSAVSKSQLAYQDNFNTCAIQSANVDADAAQELLVGDCQWGNITAYDLQGSSLQSIWQLDMQGHGSKSITVGDANDDGIKELLWGTGQSSSGADDLIVAELSGASPTITVGQDMDIQLDSFTAAGWGAVEPGQERAIFIVPSTESGYAGQRLAYMDQDGTFSLTEEISNSWEGSRYGDIVDYNLDGYADIFLATSSTYDGMFKALQLNNLTEHWGTGGVYDDNINMVEAGFFNADSYADAFIANGNSLSVVDIENQVLLEQVALSNTITDFTLTSDNGIRYLALAGRSSQLKVWKVVDGALQSGTDLSALFTASTQCNRLQFANLDDEPGPELVCAGSYSYGSDSSEFVIFDLNDNTWIETRRFSLPGEVTDFVVDSSRTDFQQLLVGKTIVDDINHVVSTVELMSASTGKAVWTSPELMGSVAHRSMHYRPQASNSQHRLMFATGSAMYLVQ